jgi:hypothetical protein
LIARVAQASGPRNRDKSFLNDAFADKAFVAWDAT